MNWKRTARWSLLILPFLLLAIWPQVAGAQSGTFPVGIRSDANAVLYEVTESLKAKSFVQGVRRMATSALMGEVSPSAICPDGLVAALSATQRGFTSGLKCAITALATDNLSLTPGPNLGEGPVSGEFAVVVQGDNNADAAELVIVRGNLSGQIDLSQAVLFAVSGGTLGSPTGTIAGRWSAKGVNLTSTATLPASLTALIASIRAHGTFTGTFRLPIGSLAGAFYQCDPSASCPIPATLLSLPSGLGSFVPVQANEQSLGDPTVRLELNFVPD